MRCWCSTTGSAFDKCISDALSYYYIMNSWSDHLLKQLVSFKCIHQHLKPGQVIMKWIWSRSSVNFKSLQENAKLFKCCSITDVWIISPICSIHISLYFLTCLSWHEGNLLSHALKPYIKVKSWSTWLLNPSTYMEATHLVQRKHTYTKMFSKMKPCTLICSAKSHQIQQTSFSTYC